MQAAAIVVHVNIYGDIIPKMALYKSYTIGCREWLFNTSGEGEGDMSVCIGHRQVWLAHATVCSLKYNFGGWSFFRSQKGELKLVLGMVCKAYDYS